MHSWVAPRVWVSSCGKVSRPLAALRLQVGAGGTFNTATRVDIVVPVAMVANLQIGNCNRHEQEKLSKAAGVQSYPLCVEDWG